jgi:hypothetical protein
VQADLKATALETGTWTSVIFMHSVKGKEEEKQWL